MGQYVSVRDTDGTVGKLFIGATLVSNGYLLTHFTDVFWFLRNNIILSCPPLYHTICTLSWRWCRTHLWTRGDDPSAPPASTMVSSWPTRQNTNSCVLARSPLTRAPRNAGGSSWNSTCGLPKSSKTQRPFRVPGTRKPFRSWDGLQRNRSHFSLVARTWKNMDLDLDLDPNQNKALNGVNT